MKFSYSVTTTAFWQSDLNFQSLTVSGSCDFLYDGSSSPSLRFFTHDWLMSNQTLTPSFVFNEDNFLKSNRSQRNNQHLQEKALQTHTQTSLFDQRSFWKSIDILLDVTRFPTILIGQSNKALSIFGKILAGKRAALVLMLKTIGG